MFSKKPCLNFQPKTVVDFLWEPKCCHSKNQLLQSQSPVGNEDEVYLKTFPKNSYKLCVVLQTDPL